MDKWLLRNTPEAWHRYVSPGQPGRPTTQRELRAIYGLWLLALILKLIGSTWDMAWHFRFLRDDFAPPHNINTVGTIMVVALVFFHTWTGLGIDRRSLRWVQAGIGTFLLAIPLDLINHRLFGLDITAWSPTHMLLYVGTAIMLVGVIRGWLAQAEPNRLRVGVGMTLWTLFLENMLFPLEQSEYGVVSIAALRNGRATADNELLTLAGAQAEQLANPIQPWVYPIWMVLMATLTLIVARNISGWRWTATGIATAYVAYRGVAYLALSAGSFPESFIPVMLVGAGLAVDIAISYRWRPILATAVVIAIFYGSMHFLAGYTITPVFALTTAPLAAALLWLAWVGIDWARSTRYVTRWMTAA